MLNMQQAIKRSGEQRAAFFTAEKQSIMVHTDSAGVLYGVSFHQKGYEELNGLEVLCTSIEEVDEQLRKWAQKRLSTTSLRERAGWYPLDVWNTASLVVGSVTEQAKNIIESALHGTVSQLSDSPALYLVVFRYLPDDISYNDLCLSEFDNNLTVSHANVELKYSTAYWNAFQSHLETQDEYYDRIDREEADREEAERQEAERQAREHEKAQTADDDALGDLSEHPF